jgi:glyoxylase-like metal-dependent hydrolase (beta-lactamase superfamily II)
MTGKPTVERYETANGALIFRLPLEVFSGYIAYAHLVACDGRLTLIDVGSGFGSSHDDLLAGMETIREEHGLPARLEDLERIIITHGHIDHFGGLGRIRQIAGRAEITSHALVRPVLVNYDERVLVSRKNVADYLRRAGVPEERQDHLMDMYMLGKRTYRSVPVDATVRDGDRLDETFHIIHVPGHAPGLVMIQIDNVLLTADHILPETSVALGPESLMPYTGVGHYVESLEKAQQVEGVDIALGGHEWAMPDYYAIAGRTHKAALEKVERALKHCDEPRTIYEIAQRIYHSMEGYSEMLKLWQTGARIEYLSQRGLVAVENLDALEKEANPVLRYRQV